MLCARTQNIQCICDVILRGVRANMGGLAVFGKSLESDVIAWLWENSLLVGNAATLVVQGNISLTIIIALSKKGT